MSQISYLIQVLKTKEKMRFSFSWRKFEDINSGKNEIILTFSNSFKN